MTKEFFAVYDSAAQIFTDPFMGRTVEEGIRRFRATINRPEAGALAEFPEDYTLFHIGSFNMETGTLEPLDTPHSLGLAVTFINRPQLVEDTNA